MLNKYSKQLDNLQMQLYQWFSALKNSGFTRGCLVPWTQYLTSIPKELQLELINLFLFDFVLKKKYEFFASLSEIKFSKRCKMARIMFMLFGFSYIGLVSRCSVL